MAKRLEERNRLQHTINNRTEGDVTELMTQKEQVQAQLTTQANIWSEDGQDEFMLAALNPDAEWMQQNPYMQ
ncbi:hypothetical protein [Paenibacillus sp. PvR148]